MSRVRMVGFEFTKLLISIFGGLTCIAELLSCVSSVIFRMVGLICNIKEEPVHSGGVSVIIGMTCRLDGASSLILYKASRLNGVIDSTFWGLLLKSLDDI